jgi:hypothetical protein
MPLAHPDNRMAPRPPPRRVVSFRLADDDWQTLSIAAKAAGLPPGSYARIAALGQIERLDVLRQLRAIADEIGAVAAAVEHLANVESGGALTKEVFKRGLGLAIDKMVSELNARLPPVRPAADRKPS